MEVYKKKKDLDARIEKCSISIMHLYICYFDKNMKKNEFVSTVWS